MTGRVVCNFSCGAASAVATKIALAQYGGTHEVVVVNAFVKQEDADNLPACSFFCEMVEKEYAA